MKSDVIKLVDDLTPERIDFTRQLIRTRSYTGQEGDGSPVSKPDKGNGIRGPEIKMRAM